MKNKKPQFITGKGCYGIAPQMTERRVIWLTISATARPKDWRRIAKWLNRMADIEEKNEGK